MALSKQFLMAGGPDRTLPKNYLLVLANGDDIQRMIATNATRDVDDANNHALSDFTNWMAVNSNQAEILSGQHRCKALANYVESAGLGEEELWWPCEIYNRGMYIRGIFR